MIINISALSESVPDVKAFAEQIKSYVKTVLENPVSEEKVTNMTEGRNRNGG